MGLDTSFHGGSYKTEFGGAGVLHVLDRRSHIASLGRPMVGR